MSPIQLPQRFLAQPQGAVELAPAYQNALFFSMLRSLSDPDIAQKHGIFSNADETPSPVIRPWGRTLAFNGLGKNLKTTSGLGAPTAFTVLAWVRPATTGWTTSPRICETEYSVGFLLAANSDATQYEFVTAANFNTCVGGTLAAGRRDFVVGTFASNTRTLYVNGELVATAGASGINPGYGYLSFGIGANPGNTNTNCWNGDIDTVGVFPRAFSASEVWSLYANPWQILKAPSRRLWATASSGGTTHDLVGANADQSNTAGTGAISQAHALSGQLSAQENSASAASITQAHILVGDASAQAKARATCSTHERGVFRLRRARRNG